MTRTELEVKSEDQYDEIERLRAELAEQCRLHGVGSEREARLMAERDEARREMDRLLVALRIVLGDASHGQDMTWEQRALYGRAAIAAAIRAKD